MGTSVGIVKESFPGERRVAVVPLSLPALAKAGTKSYSSAELAWKPAFRIPNTSREARVRRSRDEVFAGADILLQVRTAGANPDAAASDLSRLRSGQTVIGFGEPLSVPGPYR